MTRLISGVVLAAVAFAAITLLPVAALRLLACAVAGVAGLEYLKVVRGARVTADTGFALPLVVLTCWLMPVITEALLLGLLLLGMAVVAAEVLLTGRRLQEAAALFFAPWYVGMPLGMLAGVHVTGGREATLLLLATVVVSDTAQYYSGRSFGRHALAPTISPKKTIEGAIGGALCGAVFVASFGQRVFPLARPLVLAGLGVAMVGLGICGDLFESRLKRAAGLKDSAALIPGHGGVLDRIDALLFVTPAFYLYLHRLQ
jgi:phosphatidate cytidylyltransferase